MLEKLLEPIIWQVAVGIALSVIVHEVGHAILQKAFKLPVQLIEWGRGPRILKIGVLEIRLLPFAGAVYPNGSELAKGRFSAALIAAGGILAQWIGLFIIGRLHLIEISWLYTIVVTYGICSFVSLLVLVPVKGSDGYYIIKALLKGRRA